MLIVLPPPDPRLHAHAKGHWRSKSQATSELRQIACLLAKQSMRKKFSKATIRYRFFVGDNRRRDMANLIQSQKAAVDGIVDSGVIPDDSWQVLKLAGVEVVIDRDKPRVEIVIEEVL